MKARAAGPIRRAATVLAGAAVAAGIMIFAGPPAQALPPNCGWSHGWWVDGGQNIYATNWLYCEDPESEQPLQVSIERYVSPGVWTTVASGRGDIAYLCDGHAYNVYRVFGTEFADTCG